MIPGWSNPCEPQFERLHLVMNQYWRLENPSFDQFINHLINNDLKKDKVVGFHDCHYLTNFNGVKLIAWRILGRVTVFIKFQLVLFDLILWDSQHSITVVVIATVFCVLLTVVHCCWHEYSNVSCNGLVCVILTIIVTVMLFAHVYIIVFVSIWGH